MYFLTTIIDLCIKFRSVDQRSREPVSIVYRYILPLYVCGRTLLYRSRARTTWFLRERGWKRAILERTNQPLKVVCRSSTEKRRSVLRKEKERIRE